MAIKIRCTGCSRRISIDEAFAGGVCRCPYCKAINHVEDEFALRNAQRRPDAPPTGVTAAPRVAMRAGAASDTAEVPVADRMVFQGVATLVLLALLLAMIVIGAVVVFSGNPSESAAPAEDGRKVVKPPEEIPPAVPEPQNPFVAGAACTVADGMTFDAPVVYCIDASGSMRDVYYYAVLMTAASVDSLGAGGGVEVIVAEDGALHWIEPEGDRLDGEQVERIAGAMSVGGRGDIAGALDEAITRQPATIILFTHRSLDSSDIVDYANTLEVPIFTVCLAGSEVVAESLAKLAEQTGGKSVAFGAGQLRRWRDEAE